VLETGSLTRFVIPSVSRGSPRRNLEGNFNGIDRLSLGMTTLEYLNPIAGMFVPILERQLGHT
jgi:hypothetical protein